MSAPKSVDSYIEDAPAPLKDSLEELRRIIHSSLPKVKENIKWSMPVFSAEKDFCYLKANRDYITLGFYSKDKLEDPRGLLEGAGTKMCHVKIDGRKNISREQLSAWVQQAAKN